MTARVLPRVLIELVRAGCQSRQFLVAQRRNRHIDLLRAYLSRFQSLARLVRREETPGFFQILLPRLGGGNQFFVDVSLAHNVCLSQDARGAKNLARNKQPAIERITTDQNA